MVAVLEKKKIKYVAGAEIVARKGKQMKNEITKEFDITKSQVISIPLWVSDDKTNWEQQAIVRIDKSLDYPYESENGGDFKYVSVEKPEPKEIYLTHEEVKEWTRTHRFGYAVRYQFRSNEWATPETICYGDSIDKYEWCKVCILGEIVGFGEPHKFTKKEMEK